MKRIRAILFWGWRAAANLLWLGLGAWTALAIFFTMPGPTWLTYLIALGTASLYVATFRERFYLHRWRSVPWTAKRLSALALTVSICFAIYYFGFMFPSAVKNWAPEQAKIPIVDIEGDKIHISNVRNFTWHTATDFTPGYYDQTYDLSKLDSMFYVVASMPSFEAVAHVFLCFGFSDGKFVAVSVEGRRVKGQPYQLIPSLFRQLQLIYVVGDERDVVGLRGAIWKKPVYFYPARTTQARKRAIFLDMMERAHSLEEHPEFYNLIFNNCMNNILYHLRRLGGRTLPSDLQVLLTGLSDRVAHRLGYIDTDLPFAKARQAFRVDQWMQQTTLDETFATRLMETIRRQEAEARARTD